MGRSNDTWLEQLRSSGADQQAALAELRQLLIARLRRAFRTREGVDAGFLEDVAQESLMHLLKYLDQFEGRSQFTTWCTSIAIRLAFTELRRRHWKDISLDHVLDDASHISTPVVEAGGGPQQLTLQKALIEKMYQVIDQDLSPKQREALLAELKGMPQEEIGRRMGSNRNAVYKLTHDARKRLKAGLESSGYAFTDIQAAFDR